MKSYKKILACIDLSKASKNILLKAESMAKFHQAELTVLHVDEYIYAINQPFGDASPPLLDIELLQVLENKNKSILDGLIQEAGISKQIPIEIIEGNPKKVILDYEKKHPIDLIIIGRHKQSPLLDILGSTANSVAHKAEADILLTSIDPQ